MTTIAYRAGVLAADTLITSNNGRERDGFCCKIRKRGPLLATAVGSYPLAREFLDWFMRGLPVESAPKLAIGDCDASGFVFRPDGLILKCTPLGWQAMCAEFFADGSGYAYAMGSMARGGTAIEAVEDAMRFDGATGGKVETLTHWG